MDALTLGQDTVHFLDTMSREPTQFEANVLNTVLRQLRIHRVPSPNQYRILWEMVEKYLQDASLLRALQQATRIIEKEWTL